MQPCWNCPMAQESFRFLILTDNHLGYDEKDPITGNDSFEAFEEMLQIGRERKVDAILHCGDLFHDNKPSRNTLFKTIELLRKNCIGNDDCMIEYLSDARIDFDSQYDSVNFQDPNFNISLPVFAIHGNHDDPAGEGHLSAWNILAATRLVNYFGRSPEVDDIKLSPLLLRKGTTAIALYGLGNIRDERLHRTFLQKKVSFLTPNDSENEWFNVLMFHQNRIPHGKTNYIPEEFLSSFRLNLVIWGHEHECLPYPQHNPLGDFYVVQPGSSVATSLCEGESVDKYAIIINCHNGTFEVEKIQLKSVRRFVIQDIVLKEHSLDPMIDGKQLTSFLAAKVNSILDELMKERVENQNDKIPFVRLRVDYTGGYTTINPQCFGQQFIGRVANPRDIIHFMKKKSQCIHNHSAVGQDEPSERTTDNSHISIEQVINEHLLSTPFEVLPATELIEKIKIFVDKDDKDSIERWINEKLEYFNKSIKDTTDVARIKELIHTQNVLNSSCINQSSSTTTTTFHKTTNTPAKITFTSDEDENDLIDSKPKKRTPRGTPSKQRASSLINSTKPSTQTTLKWPSRNRT